MFLDYLSVFRQVYSTLYDGIKRETLLPIVGSLQAKGIMKFDPQRSEEIRKTRQFTDQEKAEWWLGELIDIVNANDELYSVQMRALRNMGEKLLKELPN